MTKYNIVTCVGFGGGTNNVSSTELRRWLSEHIGEPYEAWITWPAYTEANKSFDKTGVTVYNSKHLTLVALRWT